MREQDWMMSRVSETLSYYEEDATTLERGNPDSRRGNKHTDKKDGKW